MSNTIGPKSNTIGQRSWNHSETENLTPEKRRGIRARATLTCVAAVSALAIAIIVGCSVPGIIGLGSSIGTAVISAVLLKCGIKGLNTSLEFEKKLAHSMFELFRDALQKPDHQNDTGKKAQTSLGKEMVPEVEEMINQSLISNDETGQSHPIEADADRVLYVEEMITQSLVFPCENDIYFKRRLLDALQKEAEDPTNRCPKNDRETLRKAIAQARSKLTDGGSSQVPTRSPQLKELDPVTSLLKAHTGMRARSVLAFVGVVSSLALAIILGCSLSGPIGLGSSIGTSLITAGLLKYGIQGLGREAKSEKKLAQVMFESFEDELQIDFAQSTNEEKLTHVKEKINHYLSLLDGDYLKLRLLDALNKYANDPLNKCNEDTKTIIQNAINEIKPNLRKPQGTEQ